MSITDNILLQTDSYKFSHWRQNPPGTEYKNSYIEARGGAFGYTVFFGLQAWLKQLHQITPHDILEAAMLVTDHIGKGVFDGRGFKELSGGGYDPHDGNLPLVIEALPEGACVPHGVPLVQVRNTDARFPWLPAFIETALLRAVWYPSTVATVSREIKVVLKRYLDMTSDNGDAVLPFMLHDFGARGASSGESAALGGMAHLVNFKGTDTVEALVAARKFYGEHMAGFSIPASEHSTVTCWGPEGETNFVRHMLQEFGGAGKIIACVGDSYDVFAFARDITAELKDQIIASGGTLVMRPDSGDPVFVISEVMRLLMAKHGAQKNSKGYWVLPQYIRVIQGDGVDANSIDGILARLAEQRISAENIAFGMGGALLQKVNRDTCKFAMKTSAACINGEWRDVYKDPVTDIGKRSKRGIQTVVMRDGKYAPIPLGDFGPEMSELKKVWRDGHLLVDHKFSEIRERAEVK